MESAWCLGHESALDPDHIFSLRLIVVLPLYVFIRLPSDLCGVDKQVKDVYEIGVTTQASLLVVFFVPHSSLISFPEKASNRSAKANRVTQYQSNQCKYINVEYLVLRGGIWLHERLTMYEIKISIRYTNTL
jgi:hypothetical protein